MLTYEEHCLQRLSWFDYLSCWL